MSEWFKVVALKATVGKPTEGSTPSLSDYKYIYTCLVVYRDESFMGTKVCILYIGCPRGGIGRHASFRHLCASVTVRVRSRAFQYFSYEKEKYDAVTSRMIRRVGEMTERPKVLLC